MRLPAGWSYATPLVKQGEEGGAIRFAPVSLTTLVDSPVQTGINYRTVDLSPGGPVAHYLHIAADSERATRYAAAGSTPAR